MISLLGIMIRMLLYDFCRNLLDTYFCHILVLRRHYWCMGQEQMEREFC